MSWHSLQSKSWLHSAAPTAMLRICHNCGLLPGQLMVTVYSRFVQLRKVSKPSQIPYSARKDKWWWWQAAALLKRQEDRPPHESLPPEKHPNHWYHKREAAERSSDWGAKPSLRTWRSFKFGEWIDTGHLKKEKRGTPQKTREATQRSNSLSSASQSSDS